LAVTAPHNEWTNPSAPSASLATIGNDLEQPTDLGITSQNVGALPPAEPNCETNQSQPTHDANQNGIVVSEPSKKPTSRVITPGTKMSWAQIARFRCLPEYYLLCVCLMVLVTTGRSTRLSLPLHRLSRHPHPSASYPERMLIRMSQRKEHPQTRWLLKPLSTPNYTKVK
jgi:hypothetical protein